MTPVLLAACKSQTNAIRIGEERNIMPFARLRLMQEDGTTEGLDLVEISFNILAGKVQDYITCPQNLAHSLQPILYIRKPATHVFCRELAIAGLVAYLPAKQRCVELRRSRAVGRGNVDVHNRTRGHRASFPDRDGNVDQLICTNGTSYV